MKTKSLISLLISPLLLDSGCVSAANMNQGGVSYAISNPPGSTAGWAGTPGTYSTEFESNVAGEVEHFDVYGEVQTLYSQVYWTRNSPVNLPPELVSRFAGKVMAITGYEVDQVTHPGAPGGGEGGGTLGGFSCYPDCGEGDKSVPIYHAYNHHYFSWLTGAHSQLEELDQPIFLPNPTKTRFVRVEGTNHSYPTSLVFKENPGGEFRKSYHGYPSGYAQLLHSPTQWTVEPMQIDTHNRNFNITELEEHQDQFWFLPKAFHNNLTDYESGLNPLIECPCTDRIDKSKKLSTNVIVKGKCSQAISSLDECKATVEASGATIGRLISVSDHSLPTGCLLQPNTRTATASSYKVIFNSVASSEQCGNSSSVALTGSSSLQDGVKVGLEHDTNTLTITLSGPSKVWYGVGFNAGAMKDQPYAIIVSGSGEVTERKLADHGPGTQLSSSLKVVSSSEQDGVRTLILTRSVTGATKDHFTFPVSPGDLNLISAVGDTAELAYHRSKSGGKVTLLPSKDQACVCLPTETHYLTYMDSVTLQFGEYDCVDRPRSDMAHYGDGTGRERPNQACHMDTYHGGLQCCRHGWLLTDRDQDSLVPRDKVDTYYLKWRYYFQEYKPATSSSPPSHKHLHHWVFLIDQAVNDYEEDNANYGTASIGKITARLQVKDMGLEDTHSPTDDGAPPLAGNYSQVTPLVMTPHCHAPSCIRQEFWNEDTGEIICNMTAQYGADNQVFNERGYITILPCIFGNQPGLQFPFNLEPDTNITAVKYFNNTYRHLGQMAQWTGLMVYDTDPY